MSTLRNPKLEIFARELARLKALGVRPSQAAVDAAVEARYPKPDSKSFAPNARKRAQRKDVQKRVEELLAPVTALAEQQIAVTKEFTTARLAKIIGAEFEDDDVRVPDVVAAARLLAEIEGWYAPKKIAPTNPDGDGPAVHVFRWQNPSGASSSM